ncbi:cystinosin isoform X4 [Hydra vulgaris]|uniref:Cystinosin isoform X4 n=1 Tax=Hydra vulgaris TaxID=6087 RepID=A0ABM4C8F2_HYDVU
MMKIILLILCIHSIELKKIKMTVTDGQAVELEYHVTMFTIQLSKPVSEPVTLNLTAENQNIAYPLKKSITILPSDDTTPQLVFVYGANIGNTYIDISFNSTEIEKDEKHDRVRIVVVNSLAIKFISILIGWVYFLAWSVSFYPQTYKNFKRKSVVGLNFDFVCYNMTGFLAYSFFNVGLFWVPSIQNDYFKRYGGTEIPVQANDVFFSLHAVTLTGITIIQCIIYEAYMNYKRKSTVGWSIENIKLDFTGGSLSIVQMILLAYNNNEWNSIFGDFTKFALGLFSILFDILFLLQHYVFYRHHGKRCHHDENAPHDERCLILPIHS